MTSCAPDAPMPFAPRPASEASRVGTKRTPLSRSSCRNSVRLGHVLHSDMPYSDVPQQGGSQPMMRWIIGSSLRLCLLAAFAGLGLSPGVVLAVEDFNPKNFGPSTRIDNEWFPLKPGTRLVYTGTTIEDDGKPMPRRLVSIVTDLTKG